MSESVSLGLALSDATLHSYTKMDGEGGSLKFDLSLWNDENATIVAEGVDYIEDLGTSDISDIVFQPELDTDRAKGYAITDYEGEIRMKFRATAIAKVEM